MLNNNQCSLADSCNAPLCPSSAEPGYSLWYPNEEICRGRKFQRLPWVRKQKRIARRHCDNSLFFTVAMLDVIKAVTPKLKGASPDIVEGDKKWLKDRARLNHKMAGELKKACFPYL